MNVTLRTGEVVSSASEAWRAECEARHVLAIPGRLARRDYLEGIRKRRGEAGYKYLADLVLAIWENNKKG